ncbi:MAG TPA: MCE family protein [Gemmatimonadaceae bacterium]|nr:MCE family protein [Gemmatimonadaceae bacterium]
MPGVTTAAILLVAATGVLAFGRIGELHGPTVRFYVATDEARGVIRGTDVWFDGMRIGKVLGTKLRPYTVDTARRVLVELEIRRHAAPRIRRDSRAQIRPGSSQLGAPVVFFSGGTPASPEVSSDDTLISDPQSAFDVTRAKFADFEQQIPQIRADIDTLKAQIFSNNSSFGSATRESDLRTAREFKVLTQSLARRRAKALGSLALIGRGDLIALTVRTFAETDSLLTLVRGDQGILGRMRTDTSLARRVAGTRADLATVRMRLDSAQWTPGRMKADSALRNALDDADASLHELQSDAVRHPDRYSPF